MNLDRRRLFAALAGIASVAAATPALARKKQDDEPVKEANSMPIRDVAPRTGIDGSSLGLRPNAAEDQAKASSTPSTMQPPRALCCI